MCVLVCLSSHFPLFSFPYVFYLHSQSFNFLLISFLLLSIPSYTLPFSLLISLSHSFFCRNIFLPSLNPFFTYHPIPYSSSLHSPLNSLPSLTPLLTLLLPFSLLFRLTIHSSSSSSLPSLLLFPSSPASLQSFLAPSLRFSHSLYHSFYYPIVVVMRFALLSSPTIVFFCCVASFLSSLRRVFVVPIFFFSFNKLLRLSVWLILLPSLHFLFSLIFTESYFTYLISDYFFFNWNDTFSCFSFLLIVIFFWVQSTL